MVQKWTKTLTFSDFTATFDAKVTDTATWLVAKYKVPAQQVVRVGTGQIQNGVDELHRPEFLTARCVQCRNGERVARHEDLAPPNRRPVRPRHGGVVVDLLPLHRTIGKVQGVGVGEEVLEEDGVPCDDGIAACAAEEAGRVDVV